MALIKCPECGKEFSEHAAKCPQCGIPVEVIHHINKEKAQREEEEKQRLLAEQKEKQRIVAQEAKWLADEQAEQQRIATQQAWEENKPKIVKTIIGLIIIAGISCVGIIIYNRINKSTDVETNQTTEKTSQTTWTLDNESSEPLSGSIYTPERIKLNMRGNIGTSDGLLVYDENSNEGYYSYYLSGKPITRTIKMDSYHGEELILVSYDKKGDYVGKFYGTLKSINGQEVYSGTFTNYKGGSVKFNLKQDE